MKRQHGLTLIELLIILVIIGILAAIAIPNFNAMRQQARDAETKQNMEIVQQAVEDYLDENQQHYPLSVRDLIPYLPDGRLLKNAFTRDMSEPSNGTAPGSINYVAINDGSKFWRYEIHGRDHRGFDFPTVRESDPKRKLRDWKRREP